MKNLVLLIFVISMMACSKPVTVESLKPNTILKLKVSTIERLKSDSLETIQIVDVDGKAYEFSVISGSQKFSSVKQGDSLIISNFDSSGFILDSVFVPVYEMDTVDIEI